MAPRTIARCRSLSAMTPLGIGIVGTGNIAGGYARDALTHPEIRLVAATDLDPAGRARSPQEHGCRAHASARRPARRRRRRHRHQPDRPPRPLRGHEAGARGRPPRLQREAAGAPLERGARARRRLPRRAGCASAARRRPSSARRSRPPPRGIRSGRLGPVRAIYAEVNWGRIETWHPAPAPFYDVGVLVDVGGLPADARHDDARPGALRPRLGLGAHARTGSPSTGRRSGSAART